VRWDNRIRRGRCGITPPIKQLDMKGQTERRCQVSSAKPQRMEAVLDDSDSRNLRRRTDSRKDKLIRMDTIYDTMRRLSGYSTVG